MSKQLSAALICLLALAGAAVPAQAKKGHHHHHHHHRHWKPFVYAYTTPVYVTPSCGYAYVKWQHTGSYFWKKQYYICKGWW